MDRQLLEGDKSRYHVTEDLSSSCWCWEVTIQSLVDHGKGRQDDDMI